MDAMLNACWSPLTGYQLVWTLTCLSSVSSLHAAHTLSGTQNLVLKVAALHGSHEAVLVTHSLDLSAQLKPLVILQVRGRILVQEFLSRMCQLYRVQG